MFGISWAEFLVIFLVAVLIIPARRWPDVAAALARVVKFVRGVIWRITDVSEAVCDRIEREAPLDDIINTTSVDLLDTISVPRPRRDLGKKSGGRKCKK